jgi:uncharacterized protein YndB with AHSA1/START domain
MPNEPKTTNDELGTLSPEGEQFSLRYERLLPYPPQRVWQAITEPADVRGWFPAAIHGQWAPGAELRFVFENGEGPTMTGRVHQVDPPKLLEFSWGEEVLRFELADHGDGGCRLIFVNTFADGGKAARDGSGWHVCLEQLAGVLAGRIESRGRDHFDDVYAEYAERFGPDHATAPIPPV